jgi:hypothetical protein
MRALALCLVVGCSSGPPIVSGTVVDDTSNAVAGAKVQVCNETLCTLGDADDAGAFHVTVPVGSGYHVIAHAPSTDPRDTSAGIGLIGDVTSDVTLQVVIPVMGTRATSSSAAVTTDLSVALPSGVPWVAGAAVTHGPTFGKAVLATWALAPWATYAPGTAVTIANHFGLAAGSTVFVYAVNDTTADLLAPSQATVSMDGSVITGATIDRFTWVVLAVP